MAIVQPSATVIDFTFPEVSFQIGEETYRLRFDFEAISAFQYGSGINLITDTWELSALNLVALLWAGLRRFHPDVTFEKVESWVTVKSSQQLYKLALQAMQESLPEPDPPKTAEDVLADPPAA